MDIQSFGNKRFRRPGMPDVSTAGAGRTDDRHPLPVRPLSLPKCGQLSSPPQAKVVSVGQAKHKMQYSTLRATTSLEPDGTAELAKQVGDSVTSSIPGGASVRFEGATPGRLEFTVRGGAHTWGSRAVMSFHMSIARMDPSEPRSPSTSPTSVPAKRYSCSSQSARSSWRAIAPTRNSLSNS